MILVQSIMICVFVWTILRTCQIVHMKSKQIDVYMAIITSTQTGKGAASPLWVGSPVYTGDQQSKAAKQSSSQQQSNTKLQQQRQRKPSIFLHTVGPSFMIV